MPWYGTPSHSIVSSLPPAQDPGTPRGAAEDPRDDRADQRRKPGTSSHHSRAEAAATFNGERARLAEWDTNQLRGQLGLNSLACTSLCPAVASPQPLPRPKRKCKASAQQATSLTAMEAHFQQQLSIHRDNDDRIRQSLRSRRWTESQIHTLLFPSSPTSSSAAAEDSIIIILLSLSGSHDSG